MEADTGGASVKANGYSARIRAFMKDTKAVVLLWQQQHYASSKSSCH
jgi:hypothetical protein